MDNTTALVSCFAGAYRDQGSCALITEVYASVVAWIEAIGHEPSGAMFNIYHVSPQEKRNPDEFVAVICCPVKGAGKRCPGPGPLRAGAVRKKEIACFWRRKDCCFGK